MHTIANKTLIHALLLALQESDLLRYIALDQGQADEDLEGNRYIGMKYPAALIDIQNERVEKVARDLLSAEADIAIRLFFDTPLIANMAAPQSHIDAVTEHYDVMEKVIKVMKDCQLYYRGFTRGTRERSIVELILHFKATGHIY